MLEAFWQSVIAFVWQPIVQFWRTYAACLDNKQCNPAWQTGHCVAGFAFPFIGATFGGLYAAKHAGSGHQVLACVLVGAAISTLLGCVLWVIPKEFWWDLRQENATVSGGIDDALHYWVASAVAWFVILAVVWYLGVN